MIRKTTKGILLTFTIMLTIIVLTLCGVIAYTQLSKNDFNTVSQNVFTEMSSRFSDIEEILKIDSENDKISILFPVDYINYAIENPKEVKMLNTDDIYKTINNQLPSFLELKNLQLSNNEESILFRIRLYDLLNIDGRVFFEIYGSNPVNKLYIRVTDIMIGKKFKLPRFILDKQSDKLSYSIDVDEMLKDQVSGIESLVSEVASEVVMDMAFSIENGIVKMDFVYDKNKLLKYVQYTSKQAMETNIKIELGDKLGTIKVIVPPSAFGIPTEGYLIEKINDNQIKYTFRTDLGNAYYMLDNIKVDILSIFDIAINGNVIYATLKEAVLGDNINLDINKLGDEYKVFTIFLEDYIDDNYKMLINHFTLENVNVENNNIVLEGSVDLNLQINGLLSKLIN